MTRLNRMFPRIVAAKYPVPSHLSPEVCDLISRLITVDTNSRRASSVTPHCTLPAALGPRAGAASHRS